jgi:hypothetical protein
LTGLGGENVRLAQAREPTGGGRRTAIVARGRERPQNSVWQSEPSDAGGKSAFPRGRVAEPHARAPTRRGSRAAARTRSNLHPTIASPPRPAPAAHRRRLPAAIARQGASPGRIARIGERPKQQSPDENYKVHLIARWAHDDWSCTTKSEFQRNTAGDTLDHPDLGSPAGNPRNSIVLFYGPIIRLPRLRLHENAAWKRRTHGPPAGMATRCRHSISQS